MSIWKPYCEDDTLDVSSVSDIKPEIKSSTNSPSVHVAEDVRYEYPVGQSSYYQYWYQYPQQYYYPQPYYDPNSAAVSLHHVQPEASSSSDSSVLCNSRRLSVDDDELSDDPSYQEFEQNALRVMTEKNGGVLLGDYPRMRRAVITTSKDAAEDGYKQRRLKNNIAAKQSRDRRKMREIHLGLKANYLKKELARLQAQLATKLCGHCSRL
ncbi:transcription factor VBP-like [Achroia grisella]|uniref:transcription factor VBP-like n=1 Tax=Achroia grisella TaxID=688607 RepID=UPI0027D26953|nr:transcription factor VBP-like [Achroia grisella]